MGFSAKDATESKSAGWAARCELWKSQSGRASSRRRREREHEPLLLTGHGLSLRVDQGCLCVRDGNTHYPSTRREWRFFNGALEIPSAIVIVDGSGYISLEAIDWLTNQQVPLVRLRWNGQFASIITSGGHAASSARIRWQEATRDNPQARLAFAIQVIQQKALNTIGTMDTHVARSPVWDKARENIQERTDLLQSRNRPKSLGALLGIEGAIAAEYFRAWSAIELKWSAAKRSAVPDDWRTYSSRSALRDEKHRNYRATHPVNAMLNYAYGMLNARVHAQVVADGFDRAIGVVHSDVRKAESGTLGFVLDQIEPMRPVADRAVLQLVQTQTFSRADFPIQPDGACRLNPELARRVAQLAASLCSAQVPLT